MRKKLRKKRGQIFSEYAITIIIAVAAITAMSLYLQRGLQGRIRGARRYMFGTIHRDNPDLSLYQEYEPYYQESNTYINYLTDHTVHIGPGPSTGIYTKSIGEVSNIDSSSVQKPASAASSLSPVGPWPPS